MLTVMKKFWGGGGGLRLTKISSDLVENHHFSLFEPP